MSLPTLLNSLLVLRHKTHVYHWLLKSTSFIELHELFGKQYDAILLNADRLAEYLVIKKKPFDTKLTKAISNSVVKEEDANTDFDMIENLMNDHEAISEYINEIKPGDRVIENILADLQEYHDKQAWFLRSYLE